MNKNDKLKQLEDKSKNKEIPNSLKYVEEDYDLFTESIFVTVKELREASASSAGYNTKRKLDTMVKNLIKKIKKNIVIKRYINNDTDIITFTASLRIPRK